MPLATLLERLLAVGSSSQPMRRASPRSRRKQNRLRLERCEERCTPALLLDVGVHDLLPNTPNQEIDLFIESTDPANDPKLANVNLAIEIGNAPHRGGAGFDPYPNFQEADFSGGIWDEFSYDISDNTPGSTPYHAESWLALELGAEVVGNGKFVTLIVDTTGFVSGEFPLKLSGVGAEFGHSISTNFSYEVFNPDTGVTTFPTAPVTITNGTIRITSGGAAPAVDLNGTSAGTGFSAFYTQGEDPVAVLGTTGNGAATITDADSTIMSSATISLSGVQNGTSELLAVNTGGSQISAAYNAGTHVLTLSGSDTISNYQQVLRTLTYQNTAAPLTPAIRGVSVTVSDGASSSTPAASSVTAYDLSFPWYNTAAPTNVDNSLSGTTINDALLVVSDLRNQGTRQLPPTIPAGEINYVDVDHNNRVTINDALQVVSHLRNQQPGGEGEAFAAEQVSTHAKAEKALPRGIVEADLPDALEESVHDLALLAVMAELG